MSSSSTLVFVLLLLATSAALGRLTELQSPECRNVLLLLFEHVRATTLHGLHLLFTDDGAALVRDAFLGDDAVCVVAFGGNESPRLARGLERGLRRRGVRAVFLPDAIDLAIVEPFLQGKRVMFVSDVLTILKLLLHRGWLCRDRAAALVLPHSGAADEAAVRLFAASVASVGCEPASISVLQVFDPGHRSVPLEGWVLPGVPDPLIQRKQFKRVAADCVLVDEYARPILRTAAATFQLALGACGELKRRVQAGEITASTMEESRVGGLLRPVDGADAEPVVLEETWWATIPASAGAPASVRPPARLVPLVICTRFFTAGTASVVHRLADWLAWHEAVVGQGNLEIHFYLFGADAETMTLLQLHVARGTVILHDWSPFSSHERTARTWQRAQLAYLSDCFARNELRARNIANMDVDEFLIARDVLGALDSVAASPRVHSISTFFVVESAGSSASRASTFDRFRVVAAEAAPTRPKYVLRPSSTTPEHNVFLLPNVHSARQLDGAPMDAVDADVLWIAHAQQRELAPHEIGDAAFDWCACAHLTRARDTVERDLAAVARVVESTDIWDAPLVPVVQPNGGSRAMLTIWLVFGVMFI